MSVCRLGCPARDLRVRSTPRDTAGVVGARGGGLRSDGHNQRRYLPKVSFRLRRALVGLVECLRLLALPAVASATITPALTVTPTERPPARTPRRWASTRRFLRPRQGLPQGRHVRAAGGLLANANQDGGVCLLSSAPNASCQVGSGTVTAGGTPAPVSLYLVQGARTPAMSPASRSCWATARRARRWATADVTLRSTPTVGLEHRVLWPAERCDQRDERLVHHAADADELPEPCGERLDDRGLAVQSTTAKTATAPLNVTGCSALPYAPVLTATVTKDAKDTGGELVLGDHAGRERVGQQEHHARPRQGDHAERRRGRALPDGFGPGLHDRDRHGDLAAGAGHRARGRHGDAVGHGHARRRSRSRSRLRSR